MSTLAKYSLGIGDRFGREGRAQLKAFMRTAALGVTVIPVWNKSHREHLLVGSRPSEVRREAETAVAELGWQNGFHVDADHINLGNVDLFLADCDFFTIDVADMIGRNDRTSSVPADYVRRFMASARNYFGVVSVPDLKAPLQVEPALVERTARQYLAAIEEAGRIYRRIEAVKGRDAFVTEISMDESAHPQRLVELLFILKAIADEGIPVQTVAPKFCGSFLKGVDYVGDIDQFAREFEEHLAVVRFAVQEFGLPSGLKLSIHSGSDKFSLYGPIRRAIRKHDAGLHLKTAGTTWLAELTGLALSGADGLAIAKEIYCRALDRMDEMTVPYAAVLAIDRAALPPADAVREWNGDQFAAALLHNPACSSYNPHFRARPCRLQNRRRNGAAFPAGAGNVPRLCCSVCQGQSLRTSPETLSF